MGSRDYPALSVKPVKLRLQAGKRAECEVAFEDHPNNESLGLINKELAVLDPVAQRNDPAHRCFTICFADPPAGQTSARKDLKLKRKG